MATEGINKGDKIGKSKMENRQLNLNKNFQEIDKNNIVEDNRGLFIPKTEKDVEERLSKALEEAKSGGWFNKDHISLAEY